MSRTKHRKWDERTNGQWLSQCVKFESRRKRKRFKNLEITNGNYLKKLMADKWNYS